MWGKYLWKLRLLLFIPILLFSIFMFSSIDSDNDYASRYWLIFAVYMLFSTILLHKMEKREKK
jgi:hypothetical protein